MTLDHDATIRRTQKLLRKANADLRRSRKLDDLTRKLRVRADRLVARAEARQTEARALAASRFDRPTVH